MAQPAAAVATAERLYEGQPGTTEATLYTAPAYASGSPYQAGATALAKRLIVCNTTASAATLTLYLVPSGGTAGVANMLFNALSVAAGTTQILDLEQSMNPGDFIAGLQSVAAALTVSLSGATFQ